MPELIAWPFPPPAHFTEQLGYERAAGPILMPETMRAAIW
jgi:hypothetical protein